MKASTLLKIIFLIAWINVALSFSGIGVHGVEGTDTYYRQVVCVPLNMHRMVQAKSMGYRARSAFKLLELDDAHGILTNVRKVVDLAAAPGSWSQVISERLAAHAADGGERVIVAVDVQTMHPIEGVKLVQGDITNDDTAARILALVGEAQCDLVVSDGAPDVTGFADLDEYGLVTCALRLASILLRKGGAFVVKVFIDDPSQPFPQSLLFCQLRSLFSSVVLSKPSSSRGTSHEHFAVCKNFCPPDNFIPKRIMTSCQGDAQSSALDNLLTCGSLSQK